MQFFRIKNRRYVCSRLHHNLVPIHLTSHPVQYSSSRIYRLYSYQLTCLYFLCCLFYDPVQRNIGTEEERNSMKEDYRSYRSSINSSSLILPPMACSSSLSSSSMVSMVWHLLQDKRNQSLLHPFQMANSV